MLDLHNELPPNPTELLNPIEIIDAMIDLRIQLSHLEQQIQSLQPSFFAACLALNTEKIALERAIITTQVASYKNACSRVKAKIKAESLRRNPFIVTA